MYIRDIRCTCRWTLLLVSVWSMWLCCRYHGCIYDVFVSSFLKIFNEIDLAGFTLYSPVELHKILMFLPQMPFLFSIIQLLV